MKVFILVTCRKPELLPASTLVFKSLRTGFPTAEVTAFVNCAPDHECGRVITEAMLAAGVNAAGWEPRTDNDPKKPTTIHHRFIYELLLKESDPFWICDTDVIFWGQVEGKGSSAPMLGRYIPQFRDKFTNCVTRPRLHTSLLWFNTPVLKRALSQYWQQFPETPFNPRPNLIYPAFYPFRVGAKVTNYFHDTCSLLYQAVGGQSFSTAELDLYDHLNFATISDIVAPFYPELRFRESHFAVFENTKLAKGAWRDQDRFYAANAV